MLNILIADNNYETAAILINFVTSKSKQFKLIGIANNSKQAIQLITERKPQVILANLETPNETKIKSYADFENYFSYKPHIIVISKEIILLHGSSLKYLNKILDYNIIIKTLEHLNKKNRNIEILTYITQELEQYNFDKRRLGYNYLKDSILIAIKSKKKLTQKELFQRVAMKHMNVNYKNIQWSIEKLLVSCDYKEKNYITSKTIIMDTAENIKSIVSFKNIE